MANRVNVKFVVILSAVLVVISGGVALLAARVVLKSAEDQVELGDIAVQAGDFRAAEGHYSRAVAKDNWNKEYLRKWIDAMEQVVPSSELLFRERFFSDYIPAYRQLAAADPDNSADQLLYLNLRLRTAELSGGYNAGVFSQIVDEADKYIEHHEATRQDENSWWPLRRYNAIATSLAVAANTAPTSEVLSAAVQDSRAVLEVQPADYRTAQSLYEILAYQADQLERQQVPGATEARAAANEFVTSYVDLTAPGSDSRLAAELINLNNHMRRIQREVQASVPVDRVAPEFARRLSELAPAAEAIFERLANAQLTPHSDHIGRLVQLERTLLPDSNLQQVTQILDRALRERPTEAELLKQKALLQMAQSNTEAAIETYKAIEQLPPSALNLNGLMRIVYRDDATYQLAELYYVLAEGAANEEQRTAYLDQVRSVRAKLAERLASDSPGLQLVDIRIALAEGKINEAQAMLERLNQQTNFQNEQALWLAGASAAQNRQPGLARDRFRALVDLSPRNARYRLALGDVERNLGNSAEALTHLRVVQEIDPSNQTVREQVETLEKLTGQRTVDDPVEAAIFEATRIAEGNASNLPNPMAAIERLNQAVQTLGTDPRLISTLARQQLLLGQMDQALVTAEAGVAANPEDENLLMLADVLRSGNRAEAIKLLVNQSQGSAADLAVATWMTLQQLNELEAAEEALRRAIELAPDNPMVLETRLVRAVQAGDLEQAETIATRATQANADEAQGATFRARVLQAKDQDSEAIRVLREATAQFPNNTGLWRLLGISQRAQGLNSDALESFNRALQIRPDLIAVINSKLGTLLALGRTQEALEFKRRNESLSRGNPEFMELHLLIEGEYGDGGLVRNQRQQRLAQNPDDLGNIAALTGLLIRNNQFDEAGRMLELLEEKLDDDRSLSTLRANWFYEQGNVNGARTVFAQDIATRRPAERADAYIRYYNFLNSRGRFDEAIVALRQALPYQDPSTMQVDKLLGDLLMTRGDFAGANASYTRIRAAREAGSDSMWEQRRIETLIRLGRNEEAQAALAALPADAVSLSTRLLEADAAMRRNEYARARELLDRIAADHPNEALVYVKRSEAMSDSPELERERLVDLGKAIELQPQFWQAYRARAGILAASGRIDEAIADLRRAVEINPTLDDLRINLVEFMIGQGRTDQALEFAREALNVKPRDTALRDRLGQAFAQGGLTREAAQMFRSALELDPTSPRAVRVLDLLLSETPPRTVEADNLLTMPVIQNMMQSDGALRLMRSRVLHLQGRSDASLREAVDAYRTFRPEARDMLVWLNFVKSMMGSTASTLEFLTRFEAQPGTTQWARLFRGMVLLDDEANASEGRQLLEQHCAQTADPEVAFTGWRALGSRAYENKEFEAAVNYWNKALERRPSEGLILNNIAFTLSVHLDRSADAVPLATQAVELFPNESDALHTLGLCLIRTGKASEGIPYLERSRTNARNPSSLLSAQIHLAEAYQMVGRSDEARELVVSTQNLMKDRITLNDVLQKDLDRLRAELGID